MGSFSIKLSTHQLRLLLSLRERQNVYKRVTVQNLGGGGGGIAVSGKVTPARSAASRGRVGSENAASECGESESVLWERDASRECIASAGWRQQAASAGNGGSEKM